MKTRKPRPFWTGFLKSGRWDSNPRRQPWEGCILPLNYARKTVLVNKELTSASPDFPTHFPTPSRRIRAGPPRRTELILSQAGGRGQGHRQQLANCSARTKIDNLARPELGAPSMLTTLTLRRSNPRRDTSVIRNPDEFGNPGWIRISAGEWNLRRRRMAPLRRVRSMYGSATGSSGRK
jgi:hypothetical protein